MKNCISIPNTSIENILKTQNKNNSYEIALKKIKTYSLNVMDFSSICTVRIHQKPEYLLKSIK